MKMVLNVLKWTALSILTLAGLFIFYVYGRAHLILDKNFDIPLAEITMPTESASIAEGFRQTRLMHCNHCHGEDLAGKILMEDDKFGRIVTANITRKAKKYSDAELYRLIRHGVKKDGKMAFPMPAESHYQLKDESVLAIIAYLRTLEERENKLPETDLYFMAKMTLALKWFEPEQMVMNHTAPPVFGRIYQRPGLFRKLPHPYCLFPLPRREIGG